MERKHKRWNPGKGAYPGIGQISETPAPSRGDIWFADLGDHTGTSVQGGCRPVLVISNDTANIHAETVNVVPLTRHLKKLGLPCHMILDSDDVIDSEQSLDDSMLLAEQITTIGKPQMRSYVGRVEDKEVLAQISQAVITQLALQ